MINQYVQPIPDTSNGLLLNRRQAKTWQNDDQSTNICALPDPNKFMVQLITHSVYFQAL